MRPSLRRRRYLVLLLFFTSPAGWAYFGGRVSVGSADLKQSPDDISPTVMTLTQGTAFNAADNERNGYYYIRTSSGQGWIKAESIGKGAGASQVPLVDTAPPPQDASQASGQKQPLKKKKRSDYTPTSRKSKQLYDWGLKLFYALDLYTAADLNNAAGTNQFSNGAGIGGELEYFIKPKLALVFRLETISKSVSGSDATGDNLAFQLSSTVVSPGVEFVLGEGPSAFFDMSFFASYAPTSLKLGVTGANTGSGTFSSTGIGFLAKLEAGLKIASLFNLYGELGYRYLSLKNVQPAGVDNSTASTFFGSPVNINLSGPVVGVGLGFRF